MLCVFLLPFSVSLPSGVVSVSRSTIVFSLNDTLLTVKSRNLCLFLVLFFRGQKKKLCSLSGQLPVLPMQEVRFIYFFFFYFLLVFLSLVPSLWFGLCSHLHTARHSISHRAVYTVTLPSSFEYIMKSNIKKYPYRKVNTKKILILVWDFTS